MKMRMAFVASALIGMTSVTLPAQRLPATTGAGVFLAGGLTEDMMEIAIARISVTGVRGSLDTRHLVWEIWAPYLEGHVNSITLINSTQRVPILLDIPVYTPGQGRIFHGAFDQESGAATPALEGIFEIIAANKGLVELRTDLPGNELMDIPLAVAEQEDWSRPRCR